jgi:hypothetical protein
MKSLVLIFALITTAMNSVAAATENANHGVNPNARSVSGGRELQIVVVQSKLKAYLSESHWAAKDVPFPKIDLESKWAKDGEKAIEPLRIAMGDLDFDGMARRETEATLRSLDWFGVTKIEFSKVADTVIRSNQLDATIGQEVAFVDYEYGMSPGFDAIHLNVGIAIATKQAAPNKKPESRLSIGNLVYRQWHRVVVPLQGAGKKEAANLALWSANDAALVKEALEIAVTKSQWMINHGLQLSRDEADTLHKKRKWRTVAGYGGYLLEEGDQGTLIWAGGLDQWVLVTAKIE